MHCTEFVPFIAVLGVLGVLCWEKIRKEPLLSGLIGALGLLFVVFVAVMVFDCVEADILKLLGLKEKSEALKFLGIGMGGAVLALQAVIANKRAQAMEKTAQAQAKATKEQANANQATEQGQRQERLKNAIEHLGHRSDSVRLGGAYELFHLAEDTKDLRQTALDILCAHIRRTTSEEKYRAKHKPKPSEEIQSLLTLLFVQKHEVFTGLDIKLQGSCLNGSILIQARLEKAHLEEAQLQGARLEGVRLQGADLIRAQLQGAILIGAQLHGADLMDAQLRGADLRRARLHGADLREAQLQRARLEGAEMQGADLGLARLHGAWLEGAEMQGADLELARLQGARLEGARLQGASTNTRLRSFNESFEAVINKRIGEKSDLDGVIFGGELTQGDIDSMCNGLSDGAAKELQEKLRFHIGEPVTQGVPEDSGAIRGTYTKEEADQWIAEYKTALSAVDDNIRPPDPRDYV